MDASALKESGRDLAFLSKGRLVDRMGNTILIDFPDARSAVWVREVQYAQLFEETTRSNIPYRKTWAQALREAGVPK